MPKKVRFALMRSAAARLGALPMASSAVSVTANWEIEKNGHVRWRGLPKHFGPWHTVYTRTMRWAKSGLLDQVFKAMQSGHIIQIKVEVSKPLRRVTI